MKKIIVTATLLLLSLSASIEARSLIDSGDRVYDTNVAPYNSIVKIEIQTPDGTYRCTGTLIRYNVVLTAGHCAVQDMKTGQTYDPRDYTVTSSDDQNTWKVTKLITPYKTGNTKQDFSLLKINNSDTSTPTLPLATISKDNLMHAPPPTLLTTGYGIDLGNYGNMGPGEPDLEKGNVFATTDSHAIETVAEGWEWLSNDTIGSSNKDHQQYIDFANSQYNPNYMFATCSPQPTDHGDSGGPVLYSNHGKYEIVGTTSWGLTIPPSKDYPEYRSYNHCIDYQGKDQNHEKISVFSNLTNGSINRDTLRKELNSLSN